VRRLAAVQWIDDERTRSCCDVVILPTHAAGESSQADGENQTDTRLAH